MLNCELCNYFKEAGSKLNGSSKHMCEFTGFVFQKNVEDYEMENHPCYDYEIQSSFVEPKKTILTQYKEQKLA